MAKKKPPKDASHTRVIPHWLKKDAGAVDRKRTIMSIAMFGVCTVVALGLITLGVIGFTGFLSDDSGGGSTEGSGKSARVQPTAPRGGGGGGGGVSPRVNGGEGGGGGGGGLGPGQPDSEFTGEGLGEEGPTQRGPRGSLERGDLDRLIEELYGTKWNEHTLNQVRRFAHQFGAEFTRSELLFNLESANNKTGFAKAIAWIGGGEAYDILYNLMVSTEPADRMAGIQAMEVLQDARCLPDLREQVLTDDSTGVRKQICLILGKMRDEGAIENLITVLGDEDQGLVKNAHWALRKITGQKIGADPYDWAEWWEQQQ